MRNYLKLGSWNAICDVCGFKKKAEELKLRWDGLMVCEDDFELRPIQDFIRIPTEKIAPPWTRPEGTDVFVTTPTYRVIGYTNDGTKDTPCYWDIRFDTDGITILDVIQTTLPVGPWTEGDADHIAPDTGRIFGIVTNDGFSTYYPCWWDNGVLTVKTTIPNDDVQGVSSDGNLLAGAHTVYNISAGTYTTPVSFLINGISPDGTTIYGDKTIAGKTYPYKGIVGGAESALTMPASYPYGDLNAFQGISTDGTYVIGTADNGIVGKNIRWSSGTPVEITDTLLSSSFPRLMSADGSTIIWEQTPPSAYGFTRWVNGVCTAMDVPADILSANMNGRTYDCEAIVGTVSLNASPRPSGYLWVNNTLYTPNLGTARDKYFQNVVRIR